MTIQDFLEEYNNFSIGRKREAFKNLIDQLNEDEIELHLPEILDYYLDFEADDFFGTEGADI